MAQQFPGVIGGLPHRNRQYHEAIGFVTKTVTVEPDIAGKES